MKSCETRQARRVHFWTRFFIPTEVSAIGHRPDGEQTRAVAVNWDADEESELDEQISQMVTNAIEADDDTDEISAYTRIFPETILYQPELDGIE